jgi:hypothetical protein
VLVAALLVCIVACAMAFPLLLLLWYLLLLVQVVSTLLDVYVQVLESVLFSIFPPQMVIGLAFVGLLCLMVRSPHEPPDEPQPK